MNKKRLITMAVLIITIALATIVVAYLLYYGVISLNNPSTKKYPVRGVDVSAYQGEIDWQTLSEQNIEFAFIKATEGSSFVDRNFEYNYVEALKTDLRVGAYHFFSFDSGGDTQADNFIKNVEKIENMLPPVVDFEFYGDKENSLPEAAGVRAELTVLLEELEDYYGRKPIIYATGKAYNMYLSGYYSEYDIWIRNVFFEPKKLHDGKEWTFWQYTSREQLEGYNGDEKYIDMNVFNGSLEQFKDY